MHVHYAGACMHVTACMCVARVRVRMCACAGVFARVRAHACVFMRGCVCACVVGPTCARMHVCLRARARMRRLHVNAPGACINGVDKATYTVQRTDTRDGFVRVKDVASLSLLFI